MITSFRPDKIERVKNRYKIGLGDFSLLSNKTSAHNILMLNNIICKMSEMPDKFTIEEPRWLWVEHDDEKITHVSTFRRIFASHVVNYNAREKYPQDNYCVHIPDLNRVGCLVDNRHGAMKFYGVLQFVDTDAYSVKLSSKINNLQNLNKTMMDYEKSYEVGFAMLKKSIRARTKKVKDIDKALNGFTEAAKKRINDNLMDKDGSIYDLARALAIAADISKGGIAHIMRERAGTLVSA